MVQRNHVVANSLAALLLAGSMARASDNSWPLGRFFQSHPATGQTEDARITFQLVNKGGLVQHVKVAGRIYTLMPHGALSITAPAGTEVFAARKGLGHRAGDLLFTVTPSLKDDALSID